MAEITPGKQDGRFGLTDLIKYNRYMFKSLRMTFTTIFFLLAWGFIADVLWAQTRQEFETARNKMVEQEIVAAGIKSPRVVQSMRSTPRHEFVPINERKYAY